MEVEKRGAKGGFFQLFDWNAKSRKKLFSTKSEQPEISNQGKETFHGTTIPRYQLGQDNGFALDTRSRNDYYNYASSATDDSEYGTKAPGVVARLMGLDSLPTSTVNDPCFTPFIESHSFRDSRYSRVAPILQSEHDIVIFESVRNKLDGSSRNPLDLRLQKVQSRPIERFQREVLPPKSSKPILPAHNRLLSPIKSPGFIPPKNAAYIIEAAAKIMEQSPRSTTKGKMPLIGSSSHPIRIRAMKEKIDTAQSSRSADATQKSKETMTKHAKKQLSGRGQGRMEESYLNRGAEESKRVGTQRSKNKEKLVSVPVQAKANVQRKDGVNSVGSRSSDRRRERNDIPSSSVSKNVPNTQTKVERPSSSRRPPEVLRLNHQKQNCATAKCIENSEPSNSQYKDGNESSLSNNFVNGKANKIVNKIVINNVVTSRKTNLIASDPGTEFSSSRTKTISRRKLAIDENIQRDEKFPQKAAMMKDEKSVKCNIAFEGNSKWDTIDKKNNLDVVSFTFTSPIKKSGAGSNSSGTILDISNSSFSNCDPCGSESDLRDSAASSSGYNFTGGDSLSILLEQKLKELTSRVELSQQEMLEAGSFCSSSNSHGNRGPIVNLVNSLPMNGDTHKGKQEIQISSDFSSTDKFRLRAEKEIKELEYMEKDGNNRNSEFQRYLHLQGSNSVSSLPSFSGASSDSFEVDGKSNESNMQDLYLESYEGMIHSSRRKSHPAEIDAEISDTASSLSIGTISETVTSSLCTTNLKDSSYWELHYIGDVLNSGELMLDEFAMGQAHRVIAPDLFDQLENHKMSFNKIAEEGFFLERKVLFDCVCECLELRCERLLAGSRTFWAKQSTVLCKKQWLAEELYREISSCTNAEELMVDELVEKDMSSKNGKWTDFEVEAFEEGVEIEERILTSLVDELIDDFLL